MPRRTGLAHATYPVSTRGEALACSSAAIAFARSLGFKPRAAHEIEIITSELATNVLYHGHGGTLEVRAVDTPHSGIEIIAEDNGPGFDDIGTALKDGFSRGRHLVTEVPPTRRDSLGAGLGAVERLADALGIENRAEGGARVVAFKRLV